MLSPKPLKCSSCGNEHEPPLNIYGEPQYRICIPCQSKRESDELEKAKQSRVEICDVYASCFVPPIFKNLKWDIPDRFKKYVPGHGDGRGLCLTGKSGTGKSTITALILRDWFRDQAHNARWGKDSWRTGYAVGGRYWQFISYPKFIMELQDSFRSKNKDKDEESAYEKIEKISQIPYLIIDDLGAEKPTEFVRQSTYFLINEREMNQKITFITTNFSLGFLDENIDPRVASRIAGMCDIVNLEGQDMRLKKS